MNEYLVKLGTAVGLHKHIRIIYVVDGFVATLEHESNDHVYATAKGNEISDALELLEKQIESNQGQ